MKKLPVDKKSGKVSAEYIKVQSNVPLYVTDEEGGKPIVLLPAGRLVTESMTTTTTILLIKLSV